MVWLLIVSIYIGGPRTVVVDNIATLAECQRVGENVRKIVEDHPGDLRVSVDCTSVRKAGK